MTIRLIVMEHEGHAHWGQRPCPRCMHWLDEMHTDIADEPEGEDGYCYFWDCRVCGTSDLLVRPTPPELFIPSTHVTVQEPGTPSSSFVVLLDDDYERWPTVEDALAEIERSLRVLGKPNGLREVGLLPERYPAYEVALTRRGSWYHAEITFTPPRPRPFSRPLRAWLHERGWTLENGDSGTKAHKRFHGAAKAMEAVKDLMTRRAFRPRDGMWSAKVALAFPSTPELRKLFDLMGSLWRDFDMLLTADLRSDYENDLRSVIRDSEELAKHLASAGLPSIPDDVAHERAGTVLEALLEATRHYAAAFEALPSRDRPHDLPEVFEEWERLTWRYRDRDMERPPQARPVVLPRPKKTKKPPVVRETDDSKLGGGTCPFCRARGSAPVGDEWLCMDCHRYYPTRAWKCKHPGCWEFAGNWCEAHCPEALSAERLERVCEEFEAAGTTIDTWGVTVRRWVVTVPKDDATFEVTVDRVDADPTVWRVTVFVSGPRRRRVGTIEDHLSMESAISHATSSVRLHSRGEAEAVEIPIYAEPGEDREP